MRARSRAARSPGSSRSANAHPLLYYQLRPTRGGVLRGVSYSLNCSIRHSSRPGARSIWKIRVQINHLVGLGEDGGGNVEAEVTRRSQVDDKFERTRPLDGKSTGPLPMQ